jgi:hypothetical protein
LQDTHYGILSTIILYISEEIALATQQVLTARWACRMGILP